MSRSNSLSTPSLACASVLALALLAVGAGCEDPSLAPPPAPTATTSTPAATSTGESESAAAENADAALPDDQGANSAYGKAMERAERLKEEVAEYQRKVGEAADGKFPK